MEGKYTISLSGGDPSHVVVGFIGTENDTGCIMQVDIKMVLILHPIKRRITDYEVV